MGKDVEMLVMMETILQVQSHTIYTKSHIHVTLWRLMLDTFDFISIFRQSDTISPGPSEIADSRIDWIWCTFLWRQTLADVVISASGNR